MNIYRILENGYFGGVTDVPDGTKGIPPGNTRTPVPEIPDGHYAVWHGRGWSLTTVAPPVRDIPNSERIKEIVIAETQRRLDEFAQTRLYDGILSLCTYANSSVPKFAAEGQRGIELRDSTWASLYTILAEVESGTRPVPASFDEIEPLLPNLTWGD